MDYTVSPQEYGGFTNNSADGETLDIVKKTYKLPKISNLYLTAKDLEGFMSVKPII